MDESQDTGYLILSLTETLEESRRLRDELRHGKPSEKTGEESPAAEAEMALPPGP